MNSKYIVVEDTQFYIKTICSEAYVSDVDILFHHIFPLYHWSSSFISIEYIELVFDFCQVRLARISYTLQMKRGKKRSNDFAKVTQWVHGRSKMKTKGNEPWRLPSWEIIYQALIPNQD